MVLTMQTWSAVDSCTPPLVIILLLSVTGEYAFEESLIGCVSDKSDLLTFNHLLTSNCRQVVAIVPVYEFFFLCVRFDQIPQHKYSKWNSKDEVNQNKPALNLFVHSFRRHAI